MKTKGKRKQPPRSMGTTSGFGSKGVRAKEYQRLSLRDDTGERSEVILFPTNNPWWEERLLCEESSPELRLDLTRAFRMFTLTERRVLYRVLCQRQAVTVATARMKKRSPRWWRRWYAEKAIPMLRERLEDYQVKGKVVI